MLITYSIGKIKSSLCLLISGLSLGCPPLTRLGCQLDFTLSWTYLLRVERSQLQQSSQLYFLLTPTCITSAVSFRISTRGNFIWQIQQHIWLTQSCYWNQKYSFNWNIQLCYHWKIGIELWTFCPWKSFNVRQYLNICC